MGTSEVQIPTAPSTAHTSVARPHRAATTVVVCSLAAATRVWLNNGSRMRWEPHVRFCERLAVRLRRATHLVVGFEHEADAQRFWGAMRDRLREFSLSLHPEKTRLIEFGRYAAERRTRRGLGRPEILYLPRLHLHLRQNPAGKISAL